MQIPPQQEIEAGSHVHWSFLDAMNVDLGDGDVEFDLFARGFILPEDGDISVKTASGNDRVYTLKAGLWPIAISKIYATGTTSVTGIIVGF